MSLIKKSLLHVILLCNMALLFSPVLAQTLPTLTITNTNGSSYYQNSELMRRYQFTVSSTIEEGTGAVNPVATLALPANIGCLDKVYYSPGYADVQYSSDNGQSRLPQSNESCDTATHVRIILSNSYAGEEMYLSVHIKDTAQSPANLCAAALFSADNAQYVEQTICASEISGSLGLFSNGVTSVINGDNHALQYSATVDAINTTGADNYVATVTLPQGVGCLDKVFYSNNISFAEIQYSTDNRTSRLPQSNESCFNATDFKIIFGSDFVVGSVNIGRHLVIPITEPQPNFDNACSLVTFSSDNYQYVESGICASNNEVCYPLQNLLWDLGNEINAPTYGFNALDNQYVFTGRIATGNTVTIEQFIDEENFTNRITLFQQTNDGSETIEYSYTAALTNGLNTFNIYILDPVSGCDNNSNAFKQASIYAGTFLISDAYSVTSVINGDNHELHYNAVVDAINTTGADNYVATVSIPDGIGCLDKVFYGNSLTFGEIQYSTDNRTTRSPQSNESCVQATDFRIIFGSDYISGPVNLNWNIVTPSEQPNFDNVCSTVTFSSDTYQYAESGICTSNDQICYPQQSVLWNSQNIITVPEYGYYAQNNEHIFTGTIAGGNTITIQSYYDDGNITQRNIIYQEINAGNEPVEYSYTATLNNGHNQFSIIIDDPNSGCDNYSSQFIGIDAGSYLSIPANIYSSQIVGDNHELRFSYTVVAVNTTGSNNYVATVTLPQGVGCLDKVFYGNALTFGEIEYSTDNRTTRSPQSNESCVQATDFRIIFGSDYTSGPVDLSWHLVIPTAEPKPNFSNACPTLTFSSDNYQYAELALCASNNLVCYPSEQALWDMNNHINAPDLGTHIQDTQYTFTGIIAPGNTIVIEGNTYTENMTTRATLFQQTNDGNEPIEYSTTITLVNGPNTFSLYILPGSFSSCANSSSTLTVINAGSYLSIPYYNTNPYLMGDNLVLRYTTELNAVNTISGDNYVATISVPQGIGCLDSVYYNTDTLPFAEIQYSNDNRASRQPQSNESCVNATDFRVIFGSDFVSGPATLHWHIVTPSNEPQPNLEYICSVLTFSSDSYQYAETSYCITYGQICYPGSLDHLLRNIQNTKNISQDTTVNTNNFVFTGTVSVGNTATISRIGDDWIEVLYEYTNLGNQEAFVYTASLNTGINNLQFSINDNNSYCDNTQTTNFSITYGQSNDVCSNGDIELQQLLWNLENTKNISQDITVNTNYFVFTGTVSAGNTATISRIGDDWIEVLFEYTAVGNQEAFVYTAALWNGINNFSYIISDPSNSCDDNQISNFVIRSYRLIVDDWGTGGWPNNGSGQITGVTSGTNTPSGGGGGGGGGSSNVQNTNINTNNQNNNQNTKSDNNTETKKNTDEKKSESKEKPNLTTNEIVELYKPDLKMYVSLKLLGLKRISQEKVKQIPASKQKRLGVKITEKIQKIADGAKNSKENRSSQLTRLIAITRYIQENYSEKSKIYFIAKYIEENIIKSLE